MELDKLEKNKEPDNRLEEKKVPDNTPKEVVND